MEKELSTEEKLDLAKTLNLTAEIPPMNSVKLSINAKGQLTGEVKFYSNDLMEAYIESFNIISIIKAKNEKTL